MIRVVDVDYFSLENSHFYFLKYDYYIILTKKFTSVIIVAGQHGTGLPHLLSSMD